MSALKHSNESDDDPAYTAPRGEERRGQAIAGAAKAGHNGRDEIIIRCANTSVPSGGSHPTRGVQRLAGGMVLDRSMRNFGLAACTITLLGIDTAVAADSPPADGLKAGPYIGADVGWIGYRYYDQGYSVHLTGFTYSAFVGYQFNRYVALEGSYLGPSQADTTVAGVDLTLKTHALQAAVVGALPLTPTGGLYARAGLVSWHADASSPAPALALALSASANGTDGLYGLGAYLTNRQHLTGRLEVTTANVHGTRIYRATLGAYWSF